MVQKRFIGWFPWGALVLVCLFPSPTPGAEKGEVFVSPLFDQLGVRPDEIPDRVSATVQAPERLHALGLDSVRAGDGIELIDEGGGRIKVRHVPTDRTLDVLLK